MYDLLMVYALQGVQERFRQAPAGSRDSLKKPLFLHDVTASTVNSFKAA
jgi:hypothetical protein